MFGTNGHQLGIPNPSRSVSPKKTDFTCLLNPDHLDSLSMQILSWEFCAHGHEEYVPRRALLPQAAELAFFGRHIQVLLPKTSLNELCCMSCADLLWELCAHGHEEYVPRRALLSQAAELAFLGAN